MAGVLEKRVAVAAREIDADSSGGKKGCFVKLQEGLDYISIVIQDFLEARFYWFGLFMATYPLRTICAALVVCGALGSGLLFWEKRDDQDVWLPMESELRQKKEWLTANFPENMYHETVLIVGDDVLTPEVLDFMHNLEDFVSNLKTKDASWESVCARPGAIIPLMGAEEGEIRQKRALEASPKGKNITEATGAEDSKITPRINAPEDVHAPAAVATSAKSSAIVPGGKNLVTPVNFDEEEGILWKSGKKETEESTSETEEEKVFVPFLGFEVSKEVDRMFKKYMEHKGAGGQCMVANILSVLEEGIDPDRNGNFTDLIRPERIREKFTKAFTGRAFLSDARNISIMLSGVKWSEDGRVSGAKATIMVWLVKSPLGEEMSPENLVIREWERLFVKSVLEYAKNNSIPGVRVHTFTHSSFLDAMASMQDQNMSILFGGFALILVYVFVTLGRFNCLEQRILLSFVGVINVGLSILASYGLCSYAGLFFGPIHPILPFLLLGIGVDDMFIIVQSLKTLSPKERSSPVPERIGCTLKSAGVSITITSATDILAFGIGATTVMPSLSSFCLFAAAGIMCVFSLQLTVFVPCLALDEMRLDDRRNACVPCLPMRPSYEPNSCSQTSYLVLFFRRIFSPFVLSTPVKVLTILTCAGMLGVNIWGVLNISQNFDQRRYITWGSYQDQYLKAMEEYFPDHGENSAFYISDIEFWKETETLEELYNRAVTDRFIQTDTVDFWHHSFVEWLKKNDRAEYADGKNNSRVPVFKDEFDYQEAVREYLISTREGHYYLQDLTFNGTLIGEFRIQTSKLKFKHKRLSLSSDKEAAMNSVFDIEHSIHFSTSPPGRRSLSVFSMIYISWEANMVISGELMRNLGLTLSAVFAVTLILIGDVRVSLWVFACVALTLADIVGSIHYWGLDIEITTSICLILAVGLAVDYAAHVGHMFVALRGTRQERAKETLVRIGPAVFNGAFSTFMAFVMLGYTDDYAFSAFFKVFFCVVFYGLFHGLIFLPVILSLIGPSTLYRSPSESEGKGSTPFSVTIAMPNGSVSNGQAGLTACETTKEFLCDDSDDDESKQNGVHRVESTSNGVKYHKPSDPEEEVDESVEQSVTFLTNYNAS